MKINSDKRGTLQRSVLNPAENKCYVKKNRIQASGLKVGSELDDRIKAKRDQARKQAMHLVKKAWETDEQSSQNIEDMETEKVKRFLEMGEYQEKICELEKAKQDLQKEYNVDADSQEQKDLELLEKYQNNINGSSFDSFSKGEIERLKELQKQPLTEYQKSVLQLNGTQGRYRLEIERTKREIKSMTDAVTDATIEQLKQQNMIKAQKAADAIFGATDREILGMIIDDAKDKVDEQLEENREQAQEAEEKKEEQQERVEEQQEKREAQEKIIEEKMEVEQMELDARTQVKTDIRMDEVQKQIQSLLQENYMVNEELKGIEIDFGF